jgi:hypothetical protein
MINLAHRGAALNNIVGHIRDTSHVGSSIRKKCPPSIIVSIAILSAVAGAIIGAAL